MTMFQTDVSKQISCVLHGVFVTKMHPGKTMDCSGLFYLKFIFDSHSAENFHSCSD